MSLTRKVRKYEGIKTLGPCVPLNKKKNTRTIYTSGSESCFSRIFDNKHVMLIPTINPKEDKNNNFFVSFDEFSDFSKKKHIK